MVDLPEGGFFCPKAGCFARRPVDSPVVFQVVLPVVFDVAIDETFFFDVVKRFFFLEIFLISMIEDGFARRPVILPEGRLFCPEAGCL